MKSGLFYFILNVEFVGLVGMDVPSCKMYDIKILCMYVCIQYIVHAQVLFLFYFFWKGNDAWYNSLMPLCMYVC